ncbi:hypothetical protein [Nonomuraea sp. NPDC048901]
MNRELAVQRRSLVHSWFREWQAGSPFAGLMQERIVTAAGSR